MQTKFSSPLKAGANNKGSCTKLATYLEKENENKLPYEQEYFFSADRDKCNKWEVIQQIDNNAKGQDIEKHQDRFYTIVIAPSPAELAHIGDDTQKLKDYTRSVMDNYASGFCDNKGENRGMESKDLVWYAKLEHERKHGYDSSEVKAGLAEPGELKQGDQRHIHIIVSRCEARDNRHVLEAEKKARNLQETTHLCSDVNSKKIFNCSNFYKANEQSFDKQFNYKRSIEESYEYCNSRKNGGKDDYNKVLQKEELKRSKDKVLEQNRQLGMSM